MGCARGGGGDDGGGSMFAGVLLSSGHSDSCEVSLVWLLTS